MIGFICFSKTGKHYRSLDEIFIEKIHDKYKKRLTYGEYKKNKNKYISLDEIMIDKVFNKLKKTLGSQKALDDFLNKEIDKMSKCKTTTKTIYTTTNNKISIRNGEINMSEKKKVNIGSKKDVSEEQSEEQPERTIEDTEGTWLSKSKNGKAIFVTIPVSDLNKMEISKYTNKDGDEVEQVQLVTSVESIERVLSEQIKGTKLGYFKTK